LVPMARAEPARAAPLSKIYTGLTSGCRQSNSDGRSVKDSARGLRGSVCLVLREVAKRTGRGRRAPRWCARR
jgi:hypothetical protein